MFKYTKIGATVGPACEDVATLEGMIKAGMNFARLNFAHGTYESHTKLIKSIREAEKNTGEPIAILQDLPGPKIRAGTFPEAGLELKTGETITFDTTKTEYKDGVLPIDFPTLEQFLQPGERMLIDDGRIEVKIVSITGSKIVGEVIEGNTITSHKGLNFPDSKLAIPALSAKDKEDLRFGVKMELEAVGLSFVSTAKDILDLRFLIKQYQDEFKIKDKPIVIIAKIERHEAVQNLDEILEVADGIMVARGDLGLELPAAEVPLVQKKIIDAANALAKPVIVATQMLDSMQKNRRPTRAEVSDVANAVIDHADALLLTNETASGKYPILTVETMAKVAVTTEKSTYDDTQLPAVREGIAVDVAITALSRILAEEVDAKAILAASLSGETGRLISHVRPTLPILVATGTETIWRQLNMSWGVRPFILPPCNSIEELVERSVNYIKQHKIAKKGDKMIIVAGEPVGQAGNVNLVEVREIK